MTTELPQAIYTLWLDMIRAMVDYEVILIDDNYLMPRSISIETVD